jgi:hypothetical protein
MKVEPFTAEELESLERRCRELGFDILHTPARAVAGPVSGFLRARRAEDLSRMLPRDKSPLTDDRPLFSDVLRPADFLRRVFAPRPADSEDGSLSPVRDLLVMALASVAALIGLPFVPRVRLSAVGLPRAAIAAVYFAAVGLGCIVVEITLLTRFLPVLGKPTLALVSGLAVFLLAGGLGSRAALRLEGRRAALRRKCALLVVVLVPTVALLPVLPDLLAGTPLWARVLATVAVVAPLGYLMGQPFPLGAALVGGRDQRLIPWIWSIHGALAVLGSAATLVLAADVGYLAASMVGPASCLVASALAEEL